MRAYTHRFISFAVQCAVILLLAFGLSFTAERSLAQDTTTDTPTATDAATVAATDVPTDLPTVVPTDAPTEQPTDVPSQQATDVPTEAATQQVTAAPTDTAGTAAPTEAVTQAPATPDASKTFTENFQDGETSGWLLTAGWTITDDAGNAVLAASTPNEVATLTTISWPFYTLSFRVRGAIQLTMSSGGSNYQVKIGADGSAALYKDNALLGQSAGAPATDATVEPNLNWHTVNLLAPGNLLAVKVDSYTPISTSDPTLVGMGPLMFSTAADNTTSVAFDDLTMQKLDAPPLVPTAIPTTSGVVPIPTAMTVTEEPTVAIPTEVTAEPTQEATLETTSEATVEATAEATVEATTEATAEATLEATTEATAEATVESLGLSEAGRTKLPAGLVAILDRYSAGDIEAAKAAAADYFITVDNQQRIDLTIWTANEQAAAKVTGDITTAGGIITDAFSIRIQASVTLDGLLALANAPEVTLIEVPPKAVSTSDMKAPAPIGYGTGSGTEISEGVDTSGATAWQKVGIKGSGVGVVVIDTGFGAGNIPISGEYSCLGSGNPIYGTATGTDTIHGLYMVQVICDMAPSSSVYMYKATDATSLKAAIDLANSSSLVKVIVISMDLGASMTPGDGTDGGSFGLNGLYTSIQTAHDNGKVMIVSAGNNNGRYITLNYSNTATTVPMTVYAGDTIHVSWNDWSSSAQNLALTVSGAGLTTQNFDTGTTPRAGAPSRTALIPANECTTGCNVSLAISGGVSALAVQVQLASQNISSLINTAGVTGASVASSAGNLARPADSPYVIAVGAVCNNGDVLQPPINPGALPGGSIRLRRDKFSSQGPAFATGGALAATSASYMRDQVKPDLMGISHVSADTGVRIPFDADSDPTTPDVLINPDIANPQSPTECDTYDRGFNGTSAAAASVAGMTALMLSNTTNTSMVSRFVDPNTNKVKVDNVQDYLQTHTIDDTTTTATAVGYDMVYGAGLTVLGSPTYNLNLVTTPTTPANVFPASCTAPQPLYVGEANPGSSQDGTLTNPYISIAEAMNKATATQCVVVLPGEYVAPVAAQGSTNTPAVLSYESATSFDTNPSSLWSVFIPPISIVSNDTVIDGFTAQPAATLQYPSSATTIRTGPLYISNATTAVLQNNSFTGYGAAGNLANSTGTILKGNIFSSFSIPTTSTSTLVGPVASTANLIIYNSTNITLSYNSFVNNTIGTTNGTVSDWYPALVGIRYSGVNVYNNRFVQNSTSAVIGIDQWQGGLGSARQTAEVRFVDNLFNTNTINGPLIHLFAASNMRFVNNTVVSNNMKGTTTLDSGGFNSAAAGNGYFMYGVTGSTATNIDGAFEIHNNVFYNNLTTIMSGGVAHIVRPLFVETVENLANIGCDPIAVGTVPARNNWFDAVIGSDASLNTRPGECGGGGKFSGSIDEPLSSANFFGVAADSVDPWRLRPSDPNATSLKSGINTGDNQALIDIFGDPAYKSQQDVRGSSRVVIGGNPNPTYSGALTVDVGAYELGTPSAPSADFIPVSLPEDSATSVVIKLTATGGYTQTFTITSQPSEYDTNPANACGGQPLLFTAPSTVTYCPPADFHTQYGAGNTNVPVTIGFSVEDTIFRPGQVSTNNVSITITPVNDAGGPTAPNFNVLSDYFTPISQQLTPAYVHSNFALIGSANGKDYPFTYAFGSQIVTTGDNANLLQASPSDPTTVQVLQAAFAAAGTNGGKLNINPVAGQSGFFKFSYTVTDRDGTPSTGNATIVILPALAKEGVYDDASFNFTYNGTGWTPSFVSGAYNNSLHTSTTSGEWIDLPFTGTVVRFNMRGYNNPSSTLKMAFKLDIGNGGVSYQDYTNAKNAVPGLSCIDSLNGAVPNGTSDVSNYSVTGAAYTITCSGFPTGQVHSIKLTNNLGGAGMILDSAEVYAGVMSAGKTYQESNSNISYGSGWAQAANASMLGGAWAYSNTPNANFSFLVDSTVGRVVLYRTTYVAGVYGTMNVYIDDPTMSGTPFTTINNVSSTLLYGQPFLITIGSPGIHTITIKNVGATFGSIDQITALPTAQAMGIGTYQESYPDLAYSGVWTTAANASMLGGAWSYTFDANASVSFKVDSTVSRVVIYRTTYLAGVYGTMNVYLDSNLTTPVAVINNVSSALLYGQPYLYTIPTSGNHTITIKNVGATYASIDQIALLAPTQTLTATPGTYQESDPNLTYSGLWTNGPNTAALGGTWSYTTDPTASVSFRIDSSVSRMVIYTTTYVAGVYGTMNIYLDANMTTPIATINNASATLLWGQPTLINVPTPGNHTITIKNVGSTYGDIDQITLLGPTSYLPVGTYQESDFNLTYAGTWTPQVLSGALGGTRSYTNQDGATVAFKIDNSVGRVVIYRTTFISSVYGLVNIYLDADLTTPIAVMNNSSPTLLLGQPYVVNIGTPGTHTITLKNVGGTYADLDQITLLPPTTRLTGSATGKVYQDNYPDLAYSGLWTSQAISGALGGTRAYTNQNGASVSFTIDNSVSRVVLYRTTYISSVYGTTNVYIDDPTMAGTPFTTINNSSAALLFGQPFLFNIPTPGDHTITIRNVGATYADIDQIVLLGPPQRLKVSVGTYQDTDFNITYTGAWTAQTVSGTLGGTRTFTNQNAATASFDIDGSVGRVLIYRTTYLNTVYGTVNVYLDDPTMAGQPIAVIDNSSSALLFGQPYVLTIGSPGNHNITLKNNSGTYADIDQITVLPPAVRLTTTTPGTYQDTDVNLTYTGTWTPQTISGALGGTRNYTNQDGATVSFLIDGSVGRIVLYRTTYLASVYGTVKVYLDADLVNPITTIDNTSAALLFGQPVTITIPTPGLHTVYIKNVGMTYADIDQITLLPPVQRLSAGSYAENDINLTYTGTWTPQVLSGAIGGTRTYTSQDGATVKFDIDITVSRIVIYRTTYLAGVYGTVYIYLDDPTMASAPFAVMNNTTAALLLGQPYFLTIPTPGNHNITIRNVGATYSDIDNIKLLDVAPTLTTAGIYEESDPALTFTGTWVAIQGAGPSGNGAYYTYAPNATVSFKVGNVPFSIFQTLAAGSGSFTVSIDGGTAQSFSNNSVNTLWQQAIEFPAQGVGTHNVVITKTSSAADFIYIDGVRVVDPIAPLTVGQYQETYPGLSFNGAWTTNGTSKVTTTPTTSTLTFKFTGNGFGFITANPNINGTMTVTCAIGAGPDVCADPTSTPINGGYSFYNLKQGTYNVTITYTGSGGLYIDRVFVLDTPTTILQPGSYEETAPGIVYSPNDLWTTYSSASYSGGTVKGTQQRGAVVQMRFNGNSLFLYQLAFAGTAPNLNLCVFLTDAAGNATSVCSTYSQNSATPNFVAPVAFFGFGSGNHEVIIENRSSSLFNIDRILVN